ncbi:ABC transporter permease [Streptomyces coffeae]|uniref:ABC transporter permease subunit n=1 Tax=Streptomyces coffeae TaxID=621382 RepID=A0ABS1NCG8_9ACTN|nr:ABC transporter permease subunit [Streptomyces coffeae]MBL1097776.1 ABC transporter permease subunit [Streptomyces coffeae]
MIWLTWRQHRKQALVTVIALAALAAVTVPTGVAMHRTFTDSGLAACLDKLGTSTLTSMDACVTLGQKFDNQYQGMTYVGILFVFLPLLVGMFFGAPLFAREFEHGTHRLIWTQGVTRLRWALVTFGLVGTFVTVLAVVYALGVSWWFAPLAAAGGGRLSYTAFDIQGIAPIGYSLFALALGIFAGTVCRKVLPAMGVTLAGYALVRILIETLARPRYLAPRTLSVPITSNQQFNTLSGDWIYSQGVINANGKLVVPNTTYTCGAPPGSAHASHGAASCGSNLVQQGLGPAPFKNWIQYQPADRFWAFQTIETVAFLALAALLLYLAVRRLRLIA